jgi:hypothetical protein
MLVVVPVGVRLTDKVEDRAAAAGCLHGQPPSTPPAAGHLGIPASRNWSSVRGDAELTGTAGARLD